MEPQKVGAFIKELRKKSGLTQKEFADKYAITYQAVSKWENGINLPDIALLKQISQDFNVSIDNILEGEFKKPRRLKHLLILIGIILVFLSLLLYLIFYKSNTSFNFKTISASCKDFKVSGSIAYNKDKSSIYISSIDYCGIDNKNLYNEIDCNLYEKNNDTNKIISSCNNKKNITLENFLKDIEFKIDNYSKICNNYTNESLYLEINAKDKDDNIIVYKIPLELKDNCSK